MKTPVVIWISQIVLGLFAISLLIFAVGGSLMLWYQMLLEFDRAMRAW